MRFRSRFVRRLRSRSGIDRLLPRALARAGLAFHLVALSFLAPRGAFAFPELVRHNYANCTACHVSPTGGGVLTAYGRELSNEVLSKWGREGEGRFLWGRVKPPEWLELGGDFRTLNLKQESSTGTRGRTVLMQADLEAAISYKALSLVGTYGIQDQAVYPEDRFLSRRHYGVFRFNDEVSLRAGRFMQAFGINVPDHAIFTRQGLGWDQGSESYNVEVSYLGERYNLYVTGVLSRPDIDSRLREKGGSGSASVFLGNRYKLGASYFYGTSYNANRHVFGPFLVMGFTPRFFLLSELDFQRSFARTAVRPEWGFVNYQRLDYEVTQGLHVFLIQQFSKLNFSRVATQKDAYGAGVQFFPRPHFELLAGWERRRTVALSQAYFDWLYLSLHFYP
ncbi:MAG: hypothetical protein NDJ89_07505 [Oligoflexia bacterium]|nr:hypothetical protein [Oligoflexia bacterium]